MRLTFSISLHSTSSAEVAGGFGAEKEGGEGARGGKGPPVAAASTCADGGGVGLGGGRGVAKAWRSRTASSCRRAQNACRMQRAIQQGDFYQALPIICKDGRLQKRGSRT
eukprot:451373-Pelagomonas_calceolata.AAC.3